MCRTKALRQKCLINTEYLISKILFILIAFKVLELSHFNNAQSPINEKTLHVYRKLENFKNQQQTRCFCD